MPVIAFASPKGGAGKTTSSLILATSLVAHTQNPNFRVVIIDGDNNHPHIDWANANADTLNRPRNLEIMAAPSEAMIMDEIKAAKARANFVLVDLEGAATALLTYAITLADFVVVPLQGSKLDGTQARKIVKLMENQGRCVASRFLTPCSSHVRILQSSQGISNTSSKRCSATASTISLFICMNGNRSATSSPSI